MTSFYKRFTEFIRRINTPPKELLTQTLHTYFLLRLVMVGFGLILPPLLVIGGLNGWWWLSTPLDAQNSLSAYYHAIPGVDCPSNSGVYRDLFVGLLTAISTCLVVYSGFNSLEDWLLNFAGIFLAGVAFFPTGWPEPSLVTTCEGLGFPEFEAARLLGLPISIHMAAAILFFVAITAVNVLTAMNTVEKINNDGQREFWTWVFRVAMWLMPITIGGIFLVGLITGASLTDGPLLLWIEWGGIWAFAIYWLLKSIEIYRTRIRGANS